MISKHQRGFLFIFNFFFQYELKIWQIWRLHEWCHQSNTVWQCSAYMLVMKTGFFNVDRHAFFMYFVWRTRRWYSDIFSMFCVYNGLLQKVIKVDRDIFSCITFSDESSDEIWNKRWIQRKVVCFDVFFAFRKFFNRVVGDENTYGVRSVAYALN